MKNIIPLALLPAAAFLLIAFCALSGCGDGGYDATIMARQPHKTPLEPSPFFSNGASARPQVEGTIPRDGPPDDTYHNPPAVTLQLLRRGQERFNINCAVCHGMDGYGYGMVVERGYPQPPSLHEDRLRRLGDDHIFNVITHGLGKMQPYADQVTPADRYAIIAYIRALQLSQHATMADVPAGERGKLLAPGAAP